MAIFPVFKRTVGHSQILHYFKKLSINMLKHWVLRLLCAGLFGGAMMVDANPRLMVVDVDGGLDDEWALLALLRAQRLGLVRILAVTAVDGMTDINNVCVNTCRLLQVAQAPDIPIYRGIKNEDRQTDYFYNFGKDGFGDLEWGWKPDLSQVKGISAHEALARLTKKHPGKISLLCLGPLTNIAEAMKLQPDIASNLQELLIMGGNDPAVALGAIQMFNRIERRTFDLSHLEDTWWMCDLFLACGIINPGVLKNENH